MAYEMVCDSNGLLDVLMGTERAELTAIIQ